MTDTALNIALAALRTIAGCSLDAAACVRTAQIAIEAVEGMEAEELSEYAKEREFIKACRIAAQANDAKAAT